MTTINHGTAKSTKNAPNPLPPNSSSHVSAGKLQAVQHLASGILSRIEQFLHDDPAAVVGKQAAMLPREIEDSQAYFLQKIEQARNTLRELDELLQRTPETLDARELTRTELMLLFVLIESYRPERLRELGWKPDPETREAIRDKIESLGLDIINMRERLK